MVTQIKWVSSFQMGMHMKNTQINNQVLSQYSED